MYDFPDLTFVMRHGAEPWTELAMKLMLKWPNLYYSTSAFAPKHYPKAIFHYATSRGHDTVLYDGSLPAGPTNEPNPPEPPNTPLYVPGAPHLPTGNCPTLSGLAVDALSLY